MANVASSRSRFSLKNLSISFKMLSVSIIVALITIGLAVFITTTIKSQEILLKEQKMALTNVEKVEIISKHFADMRYWGLDLAVSWLDQSKAKMKESQKTLLTSIESLDGVDDADKNKLITLVNQYVDMNLEAVDAYVKGDRVAGNAKVASSHQYAESFLSIASQLESSAVLAVDAVNTEVAAKNTSLYLFTIIMLISGFLGLIPSWLIARRIKKMLSQAVSISNNITHGNLNDKIVVHHHDEVGQLLLAQKGMQDKFRVSQEQSKKMKQAEEEIFAIVQAAQKGELTKRIHIDDSTEGFLKTLGAGLNSILDVSEKVILDLNSTFSALAQGDLTKKIDGDYQGEYAQLQNHANETIDKLTKVIEDSMGCAQAVCSVSKEIANSSNTLNQRTESQAQSLEETSANMSNMSQSVASNAESAKEAAQISKDAKMQAQSGGEVVSQAIHAMDEINGSSRKIADIIGVVDEIAFQTNLLALNASVEAARAGEQGRGFAVVASEVRQLAQRSADAAKEIKILITDNVAKIKVGSDLVNTSGESLHSIVDASSKVDQIISEMAESSVGQADAIRQVNSAVEQMNDLTQQNVAMVEEATAASETMTQEAEQLFHIMQFFNLSGKPSQSNMSMVSTEHDISASVKDDGFDVASMMPEMMEDVKQRQAGFVAAPPPSDGGDDSWEEF